MRGGGNGGTNWEMDDAIENRVRTDGEADKVTVKRQEKGSRRD